MARALRNLAESYEGDDEHSTLATELQDEFFGGDSDCGLIEGTVVSGYVASAIKDNMEEGCGCQNNNSAKFDEDALEEFLLQLVAAT